MRILSAFDIFRSMRMEVSRVHDRQLSADVVLTPVDMLISITVRQFTCSSTSQHRSLKLKDLYLSLLFS